MAEDSLFWQGESIGHAASTDLWAAPYNSQEYSAYLSLLLSSDIAYGYVIPGYANNLSVVAEAPASMSVVLNTGRALVQGRPYANTTQKTLSLSAADATNPRLDRIVLRITFAAQTIEAVVLTGTPAATPSLPALTQDTTTYEVSLAYIWVAALAASVDNTEIHDERAFFPTFDALLTSFIQEQNIHNSEFLCDIGARVYPPANWNLVSTPSAIQTATKPSQMARGNYLQITADGANEGVGQTIAVKGSTVYAIRFLFNVTAGDVGSVVVTDNGGTPATITRNLRRTGADLEETILYTTPADATTLTIQLRCTSAGDIVKYGQVLLIEGYLAGPYRPINPTETMVLLDEVKLTGTLASVTFPLPATGFKHLKVVVVGRSDDVGTGVAPVIRFNGDSGNNYDTDLVFYNGNTWADGETYATSGINCPYVAGAGAPANTRGVSIIDIPDYQESVRLQAVNGLGGTIVATTAPGFLSTMSVGRWRTAATVTSLTVMSGLGNFVSGTRISLYGYN